MNEKGRNPVLPPEICIADGEAHVFGNRLYVYGSRDLDDTTYCSEQYNVGSTGRFTKSPLMEMMCRGFMIKRERTIR